MTEPRQTRSRKTASKAETATAAPAATKKPTSEPAKPRATRAKAAPKTTAKVAPPAQVVDLRSPEQERDAIALQAYLLWEQGQPGDEISHWLAAEELVRQG